MSGVTITECVRALAAFKLLIWSFLRDESGRVYKLVLSVLFEANFFRKLCIS